MNRTPHRSGLTQVEILVSIAIILSLVSLLLPMIGRAREVARGSQCKDHLHNLGIAAEDYHHQFGELPAGVLLPQGPVRSERGSDHFSWLVRLLPFVEQKPMYDLVDWSLPIDRQQREMHNVPIDVYLCPSAGVAYEVTPAPTTYAGVHHHIEAPIDADNHGVFLLGHGVPAVQIVDGMSHTLLMSEKDVPVDDLGWMSGTRATMRNMGTSLGRFRGGADSRPSANPDPLAVGGFASAHPHGVHITLCDTAVRLVSFDVDQQLLERLADRGDGELVSYADFLPEHAYPDQASDGGAR